MKVRIIQFFEGIPPVVRIFLFRGTLFFLIFETYFLTIEQKYRYINENLTNWVGNSTIWFLNLLEGSSEFYGVSGVSRVFEQATWKVSNVIDIYHSQGKVLHIADGCNGFEMFALFIGFLFAVPGNNRLKWQYAFFGTPILFIANTLRCGGLVKLYLVNYQSFDFAHHYLFKIVLYSLIFLLWYYFLSKVKLPKIQ